MKCRVPELIYFVSRGPTNVTGPVFRPLPVYLAEGRKALLPIPGTSNGESGRLGAKICGRLGVTNTTHGRDVPGADGVVSCLDSPVRSGPSGSRCTPKPITEPKVVVSGPRFTGGAASLRSRAEGRGSFGRGNRPKDVFP